MKEISVLGIDLAKQLFHVVGMNDKGQVVLKKRIARSGLERFIALLRPALIGMESCGTSHYWGRIFAGYGHEVRLIPPQFVKPYVKSNKNDIADAEAIAEAVGRPTMRFAAIKRIEQQDIQALHRVRERLVRERTALVNQMRGFLGEYGIALPKGRRTFGGQLLESLKVQGDKMTSLGKELFSKLFEELLSTEKRILFYDDKLKALSKAHPECRRLETIPGVGYITATAIVAAVGDMGCFKNGRQFAAWLGLVPRQHTTGGKPCLGRISKRGDKYLRKLLVHGARTNIRYVKRKADRRNVWAARLKERAGTNKTVVALANRTARTIWAVLTKQEDYQIYAAA